MRRLPAVAATVALGLGLASTWAPAGSALTARIPAPQAATTAVSTGGREGVPRFGHVFLLIGENTSLSQVNATNTPYLALRLKPHAAWLTGYRALHDGSLADYIGMTSGQFRRCDVNDNLPYNPNTGKPTCAQRIDNLFRQLDVAHVSWTEWNESMPNPCAFFDTGADWAGNVYSTHHNPAVYYADIEGGRYSESSNAAPKPECIHKVVATGTSGPNDMTRFNSALASGHVARFNMVIPNDCQNGHDPCGTKNPPGQFDAFLRQEVPKIVASPAFGRDGLILITYDEWGDATPTNHHVAFVAVGPQVPPGVYPTPQFSHYSLLRTLEDGFVLRGHLLAAATARPINEIWRR
jgi:phosphatidylinositol-3-phosphatase